ncbi:MAG: DUF4058 family protein [Caldilineaceae bacterium]
MTWRRACGPSTTWPWEERLVHTAGDDVLFGMRPDARRSEPTLRESGGHLRRDPGAGPALVEVPLPDVITEAYLELRTVEDDYVVVTVLELLSPTNKRPAGDAPSTNSSAWPSWARRPTWWKSTCCALRRCPWSTRRHRRTIASSSAAVALDPWPTCTPLRRARPDSGQARPPAARRRGPRLDLNHLLRR